MRNPTGGKIESCTSEVKRLPIKERIRWYQDLLRKSGRPHTWAHAKTAHKQGELCDDYANEVYHVAVFWEREQGFAHLSIKRHDREPIHDWRDLQEIKNTIVGESCEAIELYPAEARRVDTANQFHLWACLDPEYRFPFGFENRAVSGSKEAARVGAKQREIEP